MDRTGYFLLTGVAAITLAAADQPWKDKQIAQWSEDDAKQVLSNSPWAKTVTPEIDRSAENRRGRDNGMGGPRMGGGGIGMGGGGIGMGGGGMGRRSGMGYPGGGYPGGGYPGGGSPGGAGYPNDPNYPGGRAGRATRGTPATRTAVAARLARR